MKPGLRSYFTRPLFTVLFLGFSSGLPLLLVWSTLTAWLHDASIDIRTIGLFAAVRTPYSLKFLWAPLLDSLPVPVLSKRFGRRRGWLLATQALLIAAIALLACARPDINPGLTALAAMLVAFMAASQDIVVDAYRIEVLAPEEQGEGAAMAQLGYRLGMLMAGAGAFYIATPLGWQATYFIMAGMGGVGILTTLLAREPEASKAVSEPQAFAFAAWLRASVIEPFIDFTRHDSWWLILVFVVVYKLSDAFMGGMTNPFFLDIGFSKITIANIVKLCGVVPTFAGIFIGGALTARFGAIRILFIVGFLHALTNLLFVLQAHVGANSALLAASIFAENLSGGISAAAFVAYLSTLCNVHYTGTQYALLSSLAAVGTTWLSTPAGYVVKYLGWEWFFAFAAFLAIPGLGLLYLLEKRLRATSLPAATT